MQSHQVSLPRASEAKDWLLWRSSREAVNREASDWWPAAQILQTARALRLGPRQRGQLSLHAAAAFPISGLVTSYASGATHTHTMPANAPFKRTRAESMRQRLFLLLFLHGNKLQGPPWASGIRICICSHYITKPGASRGANNNICEASTTHTNHTSRHSIRPPMNSVDFATYTCK